MSHAVRPAATRDGPASLTRGKARQAPKTLNVFLCR